MNGSSINKGTTLNPFIDFLLSFHDDEQSNNKEPASGATIGSCIARGS